MAMSDAEFNRQYAKATRRGEERLQNEPRAVSVRYDRRNRKVVIELNNGCTLLVPRERTQGLADAAPAELADVRILGPGTTIAWPQLDVQYSVTGLLTGAFGTRDWMAQQASARGRGRTTAKS